MNIRLPNLSRVACGVSVLLLGLVAVDGALIRTPSNDAASGGTRSSLIPFGLRGLGEPSCRYQQVYGAADFSAELPFGGFITGIYIGSDSQSGGAFFATLPDIEITLGVTPRGPDQLSPIFAENIGAMVNTVFPRGRLILNSANPIYIGFASPFFYDPSAGNLLLDVRNFQPEEGIGPPFVVRPLTASSNTFGVVDTVSRVYAFNVSAPSGTTDSLGLTTVFEVTPVPEPSSAALAIAAVGYIGWRCRKKRLRRKS